jgi:hypothetical protein
VSIVFFGSSMPLLSEKFLILKRFERGIIINVCMPSCEVPLFMSDFSENWITSKILEKYSNMKILGNPDSRSRVITCRRTEGQTGRQRDKHDNVNPLRPELDSIYYLLALLAHDFLHVSRIMVKSLTLRLLMSYIYGAPILDISRSHTTTQHSR